MILNHNCCKNNVFHTFDYKNNVLAYKNKGSVVLACFFFKDNFLTVGRARQDGPARPAARLIQCTARVRNLSLKKKYSLRAIPT